LAAGAPPRTPMGELTALPQASSWLGRSSCPSPRTPPGSRPFKPRPLIFRPPRAKFYSCSSSPQCSTTVDAPALMCLVGEHSAPLPVIVWWYRLPTVKLSNKEELDSPVESGFWLRIAVGIGISLLGRLQLRARTTPWLYIEPNTMQFRSMYRCSWRFKSLQCCAPFIRSI